MILQHSLRGFLASSLGFFTTDHFPFRGLTPSPGGPESLDNFDFYMSVYDKSCTWNTDTPPHTPHTPLPCAAEFQSAPKHQTPFQRSATALVGLHQNLAFTNESDVKTNFKERHRRDAQYPALCFSEMIDHWCVNVQEPA